ncbi:MAG: single-stranded DNA-binding protein [Treponema sp.]|nr:single-stranded DNA-binding protein [Treponema sp.]
MTDINTLTIIGRLVRDPEAIAYTSGGTARLNISIAVNRREKRGGDWSDRASFFDITIWGKTAENIKPYLAKGKQIAVEGYLDQQRWEKDGQKFSRVCIVANNVQLLGRKDGAQEATPQQAGGYMDAGSGDDFPEDIPF